MKSRGYSLLEVLVAISILTIVAGAAVPFAHAAIDQSRAAAAASYMAGRMAKTRFEAVRRSAFVAIRFVESADGYWLRSYVDGNGNGVRSLDISRGIDRPITASERLDYHFPGVTFGIAANGDEPGRWGTVRHERSDPNRRLDAVELQPQRLSDLWNAVHPRSAPQPVCGPNPRGDRPHAGLPVQLRGTSMAKALAQERRATPRVSTFGHSGMGYARLRPGRTAYVIDLSAGGALA